ncbi:hypothetical protein [Clostridium estertheticum]|uniref:hypothetical protein n=1 Tax=Clostridium estertheticum TaxID=238834 RepID=UPI002714E50A|nr:hypothetical protein [Clostridium estertheticum]WLC80504.1 hypothetical protein KTC98_04015 [Clostridium estertheticum]
MHFFKDKIIEFNHKHSRFAMELNGNIDEASKISESIVNGNHIKYIIIISIGHTNDYWI